MNHCTTAPSQQLEEKRRSKHRHKGFCCRGPLGKEVKHCMCSVCGKWNLHHDHVTVLVLFSQSARCSFCREGVSQESNVHVEKHTRDSFYFPEMSGTFWDSLTSLWVGEKPRSSDQSQWHCKTGTIEWHRQLEWLMFEIQENPETAWRNVRESLMFTAAPWLYFLPEDNRTFLFHLETKIKITVPSYGHIRL